MKVSSVAKKARTKKIQSAAVNNYKLLIELQNSCKSWIDTLVESMGEIYNSFESDLENVTLLEKYIVAGNKAKPRLEQEVKRLESEANNSGIQEDLSKYEEAKFSYDTFNVVLNNLERSRLVYNLSASELSQIKKSNLQTQVGIRTQMNNSMALLGQQLRNAVHNAKNQEVIEGQKAINRLNDELMVYVSESIKNTSLDSTKLMYNGFCDVEAAKKAVTTVIDSCNQVKRLAEELLPKMEKETDDIKQLVEQLQPTIDKIGEKRGIEDNSNLETTKGLKF